ncbi:MAG TPA: helix-hairpin-helix domain-containing protein [Egicoccus sp.]|nr:helix-hairpin-helix domain-containing protein [Egicoccus sp.]HSK22367.1 helix-hairpin-helix domain-containing protein [Egicoccus sp.]
MILLSLVLVIAAAVLLVVGWFQDGLSLIYLSIGACLLAMLLLGVSVMLRRRNAPAPASRPTSPASAAAPADGTSTPTVSRRTAVVRRPATDDPGTDAGIAGSGESVAVADPGGDETATVAATPRPQEPDDPLADIRGLGPNRRDALLERFGSVEAIRDADVSELTEVPGVSPGLAKAVKDHLA